MPGIKPSRGHRFRVHAITRDKIGTVREGGKIVANVRDKVFVHEISETTGKINGRRIIFVPKGTYRKGQYIDELPHR